MPAGNVTIPQNHEIPAPGEIVEVRYLYAFPESGCVYQPVYLGRREDIPRTDCTTDQLVYSDRFSMVEYHHQIGLIKVLAEKFTPDIIVVEDNGQSATIEMFQREGLPVMPFHTTNQSKARIVESLALAFERERIGIIPDDNLISELKAYTTERTPSGLIKYGAPDKMHDDDVIATCLAWYAAEHGRVTRQASPF